MTDSKISITRRAALKSGLLASGALVSGGAIGTAGATPGNGNSADVVVPDDHGTIQAAVDAADDGDTICIRPGTYAEQVTVDTGVTLRGQTPPQSGNPTVVDGWVSLEADGAELHRVAVTRTTPFSTPGSFTPDPFGVRVTASETTVADTVVRDLTDAPQNKWGAINGVQVFGGDSVEDVKIRNNEIRDTDKDVVGGLAGIKLQADVTDVEVTDNVVTDLHSAGWAWGVVLAGSGSAGGRPESVHVQDNTMERLNDGSEYDVVESRDGVPYPGSAFGIDGGARADEATVKYNNLLAPNGVETKDDDSTLDAECNWWGAKSGPTHADNPDGEGTWAFERGAAEADYTPWLNAPSPSRSCTGGTDNGNGNANGRGEGNGRGQ